MRFTGYRTEWVVTSIPRYRNGLKVHLTVDTDSSAVISAIERAAANAGIRIERVNGKGER